MTDFDDMPAAVTGRLNLPSITDIVDEQMSQIPERVLDLSDARQRLMLRSYLTHLLERFLVETEWAFVKGSDRGVRQVAQLIRDPGYYRLASKRREQDRERRKQQDADMERQQAEYRKQREEAASALKADIESGKVALWPTVKLNVGALPVDERGPR